MTAGGVTKEWEEDRAGPFLHVPSACICIVRCNLGWHGMAWYGMRWDEIARYGKGWNGM